MAAAVETKWHWHLHIWDWSLKRTAFKCPNFAHRYQPCFLLPIVLQLFLKLWKGRHLSYERKMCQSISAEQKTKFPLECLVNTMGHLISHKKSPIHQEFAGWRGQIQTDTAAGIEVRIQPANRSSALLFPPCLRPVATITGCTTLLRPALKATGCFAQLWAKNPNENVCVTSPRM